jgi:hypothetical protein
LNGLAQGAAQGILRVGDGDCPGTERSGGREQDKESEEMDRQAIFHLF